MWYSNPNHAAFIYDNNGANVAYGYKSTTDNYRWSMEDAGGGYVRLKNKATGNYMNIAGGELNVKCTNIASGDVTSHWAVANVGTTTNKSIKNRSNNKYLDMEGQLGYLTCERTDVPTETTSWSAQWIFYYDSGAAIPVSGVDVTPAAASLEVGETVLLNAAVSPSDAGNKAVTWTSSNTSVATVINGIVTAVSAGNATITATTQDGGFTDTCAVTVTPAGTGTLAVRANDFLNSIGVCTHMSQGEDNAASLASCFQYAGIRCFRDDFSDNSSVINGWINLHNQTGAKLSLLPSSGNVSTTVGVAKQLANAGALLAVEGPNEPNNWGVTYEGLTSGFNTTFVPVAHFQRDLYAAVKADPVLANIPVFSSSEAGGAEPDNVGLQFLTIPAGAGCIEPAGTKYADYANCHNYICRLPTVTDNICWDNFDPQCTNIERVDGMYTEFSNTWHMGYQGYTLAELPAIPRVCTETGWWTSGNNSISQDQAGRMFMNTYLDAFKQGWSYVMIYMAKDSAGQGAWGFFDTNYNPKLAGTYLHNMTTILADTATFTPGRVNYSIANKPATVHDMLIQKGNGKYCLAVWSEMASGTANITVNLGSTYSTVNVYTPRTGTAATQTLSNASSASLSLSGYDLMIVEF